MAHVVERRVVGTSSSPLCPETERAGRLAERGSRSPVQQEAQGDANIDVASLQGDAGPHVAGRDAVEHNDISGTLRARS